MTFTEKKSKILDALIERNGLQYVIDVAASVFDNPVFVHDISSKLLAYSSRKQDQDVWDILLPNRQLDFEKSVVVEKEGIYSKIFSSDEPVVGVVDFYGKRFLGARIRDKSNIIGVITIVEEQPFSEDDYQLIIILCKAALFEMLYWGNTGMQAVRYYGLFRDLLMNSVTKMEMEERLKELKLVIPEKMRLISIQCPSMISIALLMHVRKAFETAVPDSFSIVYKGEVLMLVNSKRCNQVMYKSLCNVFNYFELNFGISGEFLSLWDLSKAYIQSTEAIFIHKKLKLNHVICKYDDIRIYAFLKGASETHDIYELCDPLINQLLVYDKENGTDMLETVEAYLRCGKNVQEAALGANVHKNTMYYRIQKLEELFDISFDDEDLCFALQLSFRLLKLI